MDSDPDRRKIELNAEMRFLTELHDIFKTAFISQNKKTSFEYDLTVFKFEVNMIKPIAKNLTY